ncbi:MAG: hypothetical protein JWN98_1216 [Abditibacteriota bacterium]|nr:hypothetical protein [Abditibacteriota bacterium]
MHLILQVMIVLSVAAALVSDQSGNPRQTMETTFAYSNYMNDATYEKAHQELYVKFGPHARARGIVAPYNPDMDTSFE